MYTRYRFKLRLILPGLILLPLSKRHNTTQITYKFVLCLLSNASMLAIKCTFACYQMSFCLLSNMHHRPQTIHGKQQLIIHHPMFCVSDKKGSSDTSFHFCAVCRMTRSVYTLCGFEKNNPVGFCAFRAFCGNYNKTISAITPNSV